MKTTTGVRVLLAALVMGTAVQVADAQRGPRRRADVGPRSQGGVEQVLRLRDRLELTEAQIGQLENLRKEAVASRQAERAAMAELRSRNQAGDVTREEMRAAMTERREAAAARSEEHQNRINGILSEKQRELVSTLRQRAWGGRGGVRGRNPRGFQRGRGFRDRSFGPRGRSWDRRGPQRGFRPEFRRGRELEV